MVTGEPHWVVVGKALDPIWDYPGQPRTKLDCVGFEPEIRYLGTQLGTETIFSHKIFVICKFYLLLQLNFVEKIGVSPKFSNTPELLKSQAS